MKYSGGIEVQQINHWIKTQNSVLPLIPPLLVLSNVHHFSVTFSTPKNGIISTFAEMYLFLFYRRRLEKVKFYMLLKYKLTENTV